MPTVNLHALYPLENLGFSYASPHSIADIEVENYFLSARDHLRPGDRLFVTAAGKGAVPVFAEFGVMAVNLRTVTIARLDRRDEVSAVSTPKKATPRKAPVKSDQAKR